MMVLIIGIIVIIIIVIIVVFVIAIFIVVIGGHTKNVVLCVLEEWQTRFK